jgi:HAD superfamily hydrolase (TIGR01549 family)
MRVTDRAVIFDVDGVLLDLTAAEENVFFAAFASWGDPSTLSREWQTYRIRNDDDIVDEIMEGWRIPATEKPRIVAKYYESLGQSLDDGSVTTVTMPGARQLLAEIQHGARLGIATANYREAAKLRLVAAGLWDSVSGLAHGADGGGHKHEVLRRAIAASGLSPSRIVYVGDNTNDVEAGLRNKVRFIGFSVSAERREALKAAGADDCTADHGETLALIRQHLAAMDA